MSCAMQRNAAIAIEAPTLSWSTCDIAELKTTRAKAMVTCDQLGFVGCEIKVGSDMGVFC